MHDIQYPVEHAIFTGVGKMAKIEVQSADHDKDTQYQKKYCRRQSAVNKKAQRNN